VPEVRPAESSIHDLRVALQSSSPLRGKAAKVFLAAISRRKSMIFDATIATVIINVIALFTSIYSMQVYDRVIPRQGYATLIVLTAGVCFAVTMDMLLRNVRARMIDREAGRIDYEVSEYFYSTMQAVRLDARPRSIGTMAAQLRGLDQIRALMSSTSLFIIADLPFVILFIVVIAALGGILAMVPLAAFTLSIVLALLMSWFIRADTNAAQSSAQKKNGLLVEAFDAAETIKANQGGAHMLSMWNRLVNEVQDHDLKVKRWSTFSSSGSIFIQQLSYVGVVCLGAFEVANGSLTMGGVIACSILSGRVNGPLVAALPNLIVQWGYSRSSLAALDAIIEMPGDRPAGQQMVRHSAARGEIKAEGVKFAHAGTRTGVHIKSLHIEPGERICLVGPVGSGKSTLLRLLSGLYACQEGVVLLDGIDVRQMNETDLRSHICYFPQDYRLIHGSLRSNLTLGLEGLDDAEVMAAAAQTGLAELIKSHPMGLDLPISEGGHGLSRGQGALVGLTRVLLAKPKILLLDEPTASLDQVTEAAVYEALLRSLGPDVAVILVTHKLQLLTLMRRAIVMGNGRIVLDGPNSVVVERLRSRPAWTARPMPVATGTA
jgi:ATP-binding cassette, subfamily C, bacterial LapB